MPLLVYLATLFFLARAATLNWTHVYPLPFQILRCTPGAENWSPNDSKLGSGGPPSYKRSTQRVLALTVGWSMSWTLRMKTGQRRGRGANPPPRAPGVLGQFSDE